MDRVLLQRHVAVAVLGTVVGSVLGVVIGKAIMAAIERRAQEPAFVPMDHADLDRLMEEAKRFFASPPSGRLEKFHPSEAMPMPFFEQTPLTVQLQLIDEETGEPPNVQPGDMIEWTVRMKALPEGGLTEIPDGIGPDGIATQHCRVVRPD